MWVIECDGDVFLGKRLWLRPGKRFIFGRTSADTHGFVIANKTISRKHLVVEVAEVKPGDSARINTRSQVTLEDLNTKIGTLVNGVQLRGQRYVLGDNDYEIQLGQYDKLFRIRWIPVVLSFSFTGKELRNNQISKFSERLEHLDIKVLNEYVRGSTTHVVAKKRNTAKGLQALINGKYIVDHSFVDAIANVTKGEPDTESPLESDFDSNWPNELQHLPPNGPEQAARPSSAYLPDTARLDIFEGYTFVFYDQSQFDNLIAPITNGSGKALLHQVDPSSTTAEDFVRYVKNVAGEKGVGEFVDGSKRTGVVVVRYQPLKGPTLPFYSEFGRRVSLLLDHRLIEQSEFLDAILSKDASVLRRPLEVESSGVVAALPTTETRPADIVPENFNGSTNTVKIQPSSTEASAPAPRRVGRSRRTVTSRFNGFDDEFVVDTTAEPSETGTFPPESQSQTSGLFVKDYQKNTNIVENDQVAVSDESQQRRKRSFDQVQESDNQDILDQLAPAATRLKRLRIADEIAAQRSGQALESVERAATPPQQPKKAIRKVEKPKKEIDIQEFTALQREKEDILAKAEREALEQGVEGMDMAKIRSLAPIEEMAIRHPISHTTSRADTGDSRWDDKWNGRMNFKKFKKKGQAGTLATNKVIVPLEEVKKKDFGIGDNYWLEGDKGSQLIKRDKTQSDSPHDTQFTSRTATARSGLDETPVAVDRGTGLPHSASVVNTSQQSQSVNSRISQSTNKRPATQVVVNPAPVKKSRQEFQKEESEDSDDGLGFRFRKRK